MGINKHNLLFPMPEIQSSQVTFNFTYLLTLVNKQLTLLSLYEHHPRNLEVGCQDSFWSVLCERSQFGRLALGNRLHESS